MKLSIEVPDHAITAIDRAAKRYGATRDELIAELFERIEDGLSRPGSWEAQHVERLLGGLKLRVHRRHEEREDHETQPPGDIATSEDDDG